MEKMLTAAEFLQLWIDTDSGEGDEYEEIQDGDWVQDFKYQSCETVYQLKSTQQYFSIFQSRSGSYHTDWDYSDPECYEVIPKTETVIVTTYVLK